MGIFSLQTRPFPEGDNSKGEVRGQLLVFKQVSYNLGGNIWIGLLPCLFLCIHSAFKLWSVHIYELADQLERVAAIPLWQEGMLGLILLFGLCLHCLLLIVRFSPGGTEL